MAVWESRREEPSRGTVKGVERKTHYRTPSLPPTPLPQQLLPKVQAGGIPAKRLDGEGLLHDRCQAVS